MSLVGPRPLILDEDQHVVELGAAAARPQAGDHGPLAGARSERHPVRRDDEARLPLRHELVAARGPASDHAHAARRSRGRGGVLTDAGSLPHETPKGRDHAERTYDRRRTSTMIFTETKLEGAFIIDLERREDERGFFARAFCQHEFAAHGLKPVIAQANIAFNRRKGTLRGMHFQYPPAAETKLVRCTPRRDPRHHRRPAAREPDVPAAHRRGADRGQQPGALRSRAVRARLPGARGRHGDELPGRRVLHARAPRAACRYDDPRARPRVAAAGRRRCPTRIGEWTLARRRSRPSSGADGGRRRMRASDDHRRHGARERARSRAGRSASA